MCLLDIKIIEIRRDGLSKRPPHPLAVLCIAKNALGFLELTGLSHTVKASSTYYIYFETYL